jgi:hypothetical protein
VEYLRVVGSVTCADSHEEVQVCVIQRNTDPVQVSMAGMRWRTTEAELLSQILSNAVRISQTHRDRRADPGTQNQ